MNIGMYYNNNDVRLQEVPVPTLSHNDILIKIMASGICGSDLMEWYRIKRAPLVLGHEVAGEIVAVGSAITHLKVGDRVFATHHVPCDECYYCVTGHHTACTVFQTCNNFYPGGFSQYVRVSGRSVFTGVLQIPPEFSFEMGTFIEPLATVVRAFRVIALSPGESILIIGSGIAGILFVKLAKALGAGTIIVSDINEYRMTFAKKCGAHAAFFANKDLPLLIKQHNHGRLADKVIICAGAMTAVQAALPCVDKGGTVLFFAVPTPGETIPLDINPFWRDDVCFKTCYGAAPLDNRQALELLRSGSVQVTDMITHRYALKDIGIAFKTAAMPEGTLKVIIQPH